MFKNSFNEQDKDTLIRFLNLVASRATFSVSTKEIIEIFRQLNHIQTQILPKIESHILEIKEHTPPREGL